MIDNLKAITELKIRIPDAAVGHALKTNDVLADKQRQRLRHFFLAVYQTDMLR